ANGDLAAQPKKKEYAHGQHANADVQGVETNQGKIGRSEHIAAYRQSKGIDQLAPLESCAAQERQAQDDGQAQERQEQPLPAAAQAEFRKVNGSAAGEQTRRGSQHLGYVEDLRGVWLSLPGLPQEVDVSHDQ